MADYPKLVEEVKLVPARVPDLESKYRESAAAISKFTAEVTSSIDQVVKEKLDIEKESASLDVRNSVTNLKNEVLSPHNFGPQSLDTFDAAAKGVIGGVLSTTDPRIRAQVANLANFYASSARQQVITQVNALERNQMEASFDESIYAKTLDASNEAFKGGTGNDEQSLIHRENSAKFKAQSMSMMQIALNSGVKSGDYIGKLNISFNQTLQEQSYLGGFHQALVAGDPQGYINKFISAKHKDLNDQQVQTIASKMGAMRNQFMQNHQITTARLSEDIGNTLIQVQKGDSSNVVKTQALISEWMPSKAEAFEKELDGARYYHTLVQGTKWGNPIQQMNFLNEHAPQMADPNLATKTRYYNQAHSIIESNRKAFAADSAGYVESNPGYAKIKHDWDKGLGDKDSAAGVDPSSWKLALERNMGASNNPIKGQPQLSLVPKLAAANIVQTVYGRGPEAQLQALNSALHQFDKTSTIDKNGNFRPGKYEGIIMNDLIRAGLPTAVSQFYAMKDSPDSLHLMPAMAEALTDGKEKLMGAMTNLKITPATIKKEVRDSLESYVNSITSYQGETTQTLDEIYNNTTLLTMKLAQKQGMTVSRAAKMAADALFNNHYNYDTMHGETYRVPKAVSRYRVKSALDYVGDQAVNTRLQIPPQFRASQRGVSEDIIQKLYRDEVAYSGYAVTLHNNQGVQLVDKDGIAVKAEETGTPFIALFDDIGNPQSDLSRSMDTSTLHSVRAFLGVPSKREQEAFEDVAKGAIAGAGAVRVTAGLKKHVQDLGAIAKKDAKKLTGPSRKFWGTRSIPGQALDTIHDLFIAPFTESPGEKD